MSYLIIRKLEGAIVLENTLGRYTELCYRSSPNQGNIQRPCWLSITSTATYSEESIDLPKISRVCTVDCYAA